MSSPIVHVSSADPHLIALTEDGQVIHLSLETSFGKAEMSVVKADLKSITACVYKDTSGLFTTESPEEFKESPREPSNPVVGTSNVTEIDDEDELLYGESAPNLFDKAAVDETIKESDDKADNDKYWKRYLSTPKATFWAFILRENGTFEVRSLPDFTVKYTILNLNLAPNVLTDAGPTSASFQANTDSLDVPKINEIFMAALGEKRRRPMLFARTSDHELLAYEVFPYYDAKLDDRLKMRFKKVKHGLILRERKSK